MARGVVINAIDSMFVENLFKEFKRKRKINNEGVSFNETIKEFAIYLLNRACVKHNLSSNED